MEDEDGVKEAYFWTEDNSIAKYYETIQFSISRQLPVGHLIVRIIMWPVI